MSETMPLSPPIASTPPMCIVNRNCRNHCMTDRSCRSSRRRPCTRGTGWPYRWHTGPSDWCRVGMYRSQRRSQRCSWRNRWPVSIRSHRRCMSRLRQRTQCSGAAAYTAGTARHRRETMFPRCIANNLTHRPPRTIQARIMCRSSSPEHSPRCSWCSRRWYSGKRCMCNWCRSCT